MSMICRNLLLLASAFVFGGCAGVQRSLQERPQEVLGYFTSGYFVPCDASADDARWAVSFFGRATRQYEHLATARLLELPQPLLVRFSGYVSELYPAGQLTGGFTRRFSVFDMIGMKVSGTCESAGSNLRQI